MTSKLKLALISDVTYRACTPDYEDSLSFYGSEPYHAVIAKELAKTHDLHFFAPTGSEPIGTFHPLMCSNGQIIYNESLEYTSLEHLKVEYLKDFDFVLDFSSVCRNIEDLRNYHGYTKYGVFRNGYAAFDFPRLRKDERHYIVPSKQNKRIYMGQGFKDVFVAYYPIPDFYCRGEDSNYINILPEFGLESKKYYLFPHRPTSEKGSLDILKLAIYFPEETFVYMVSNNPIAEHQLGLLDLKRQSTHLKNVKFVELPLTPKHHYFKRELLRHAKAVLSPFNPNIYIEGFGLTNAEAVACGTPILITDSESSRELWIDEKDGLILPWDERLTAFKMAIKNFDNYNFNPENRYTVDKSIESYNNFIERSF